MEILKVVFQNLKTVVSKMNEAGVPLPMLRENGKPSMTATMTFLSFNTALLGQIGKIGKFLGDIDLTQANYLFMICLGAYLGRRMQGNSATKTVSIESQDGPPKTIQN